MNPQETKCHWTSATSAKQRVELILKMHELTKENIERMNAKYKLVGDKGRKHVVFAAGYLVWLHLRKDRFPNLRKSKQMTHSDGPFKVLEKINDNAYKLLGLVPLLTLQI